MERLFFVSLVVLALCGTDSHAQSPSPSQSDPITVVDSDGVTRAFLGMLGNEVAFQLGDSLGRPRVSLSVGALGITTVDVFDGDGSQRIRLLASDDSPAMLILASSASPHVYLASNLEGSGGISLSGRAGQTPLMIAVDPAGYPMIRMKDARDNHGLSLAVMENGVSGISWHGPGDRPGAVIGLDPEGDPSLQLFSPGGATVFQVP